MAFTPIDPNKAEVRITGTAPNYGLDFYIPRGERGDVGPTGPQGPALPTNLSVGVVETGPETAGATGPQGPQGVKGDPGGIAAGTVLGTNDLNNMTTAGVYRQTDTTGASSPTSANYPYQGGYGTLIVFNTGSAGGDTVQTFYPQSYSAGNDGRLVYIRNKSNNVWSPWRTFASSRIDQTAGRVLYEWDSVNSREQLIYGDTGFRALETVLINGWTASVAKIRRVNYDVSLYLYNVSPAAQTGISAWAIPSGFRPNGATSNIGMVVQGTGTSVQASGSDLLPSTAGTSCTGFVHRLTWQTPDAWPTILPGTASGSISNT